MEKKLRRPFLKVGYLMVTAEFAYAPRIEKSVTLLPATARMLAGTFAGLIAHAPVASTALEPMNLFAAMACASVA
jgi:hypothetical protein